MIEALWYTSKTLGNLPNGNAVAVDIAYVKESALIAALIIFLQIRHILT